jgi:hypothetical protein
MTPPHTFDNRQYKCNRAANSKAFNSPHLLQKQVPNILKCRNVRGNESEREGAGSAHGAGQNESSRTPQVLARIITKEGRPQHDATGMIGASSQHLSQGESGGLKVMASRYLAYNGKLRGVLSHRQSLRSDH